MTEPETPVARRPGRARHEPRRRASPARAAVRRSSRAACPPLWRGRRRALRKNRRQCVLRRRGAPRRDSHDPRHGPRRRARTGRAPRRSRGGASGCGCDRFSQCGHVARGSDGGRPDREDGGLPQLGDAHHGRHRSRFPARARRLAVYESIPPNRRLELHRRALATLADPLTGSPDAAVLAITPRPPPTARPSFATHRRPPCVLLRWGPTERRPPSMPARFVSAPACRFAHERSSSRREPHRATSPISTPTGSQHSRKFRVSTHSRRSIG